MNAENPTPDNDTMLTLIDTNDQLSVAISKHQRAVLQARKVLGITTPGEGTTPSASLDAGMGRAPHMRPPATSNMPPLPPPSRRPAPTASPYAEQPSNLNKSLPPSENPFQDSSEVEPGIDHNEPYHPGFNPTKSYMGRQDSAINKVSMHAAVSASDENEASGSQIQPPAAQKPSEPAPEGGPIYRY